MATITSTELSASGAFINFGTPAALTNLGSQTILAYCKPTGAGGNNLGYLYGKSPGPRFIVEHNSGAPRIFFAADSSGSSLRPDRSGPSNSVVYNSWGHYATTWDGTVNNTGIQLYTGIGVDLTEVSSYTSIGTGSGSVPSDAAIAAGLLNHVTLSARHFVGSVAYVAVWDRVLTLSELVDAQNNGPLNVPSGLVLLFANQADLSPSALSVSSRSTYASGDMPPNTNLGGSATYTLTTDAGSFTLTGSDAGLTAQRKITADSASFALTGNDATLTYTPIGAYTLTADSGSFTLTGTDATLTYDSSSSYTLTAETGTFTLAGNAATLHLSPISVDDDYERSSIIVAQCTITDNGDGEDIVSLWPRKQRAEADSQYKCLEPSARLTGVLGKRPVIRIMDSASFQIALPTTRRLMACYPDPVTGEANWDEWFHLDTFSSPGGYYQARHNTAFTENVVYIGRGRQVTPRQFYRFLENIATTYSSFAGPTPSAAAFTPTLTDFPGQSLIAGEFSAIVDDLGRTVDPVPFEALRINDTSLDPDSGPKIKLVITAGVHAGEDQAEVVLMYAIDFLCSSAPDALYVRANYDIYIYGLINAMGRQAGYFRGTKATSSVTDANRHWHEDGVLEAVDLCKAVILADLDGDERVALIDMHGTGFYNWSTWKKTGVAVDTALHNALQTHNPSFTYGDEGDSFTDGPIANWAYNTFSTGLGITLEHGEVTPMSYAQIQTGGEAIIKALVDIHDAGYFDSTYTLTAESGSFALTGQDATLSSSGANNYTLTAETGSLTYTGSDASLLVARVLGAEHGTFTLTGSDAGLVHGVPGSYTLTAESASFGLTGSDASLLAGRKLTAEAASLSLAGLDVSFLLTRKLTADTGAFTLTGANASLNYSGAIARPNPITPIPAYLQDETIPVYL